MDWIKLNWQWLIPSLSTVALLIVTIRNGIAVERDRRALQQVGLEKEKLEIEIGRLSNDPAVVADRRAIYERLRGVLMAIMGPADVTREQIRELHAIRHDSHFRFPDEIPNEIEALIGAAITVHIDNEVMRYGRNRIPDDEWEELVRKEASALQELVSYLEGMVKRFKQHLSL